MSKKHLMVALYAALSAMIAVDTARAEEKQEAVSIFGDGKLKVPAQFKRVPPRSGLLEHEFQASKGEGKDAKTARVTMMPARGSIEANIVRWKGQFVGGDKKDQKTDQMKLGNWTVYIVDVNGSYAERMGGGPFAGGKVVNHEDYAMAGAILVNPDKNTYFVKMIGPADVVKSNRKAFVEMIKSIGE